MSKRTLGLIVALFIISVVLVLVSLSQNTTSDVSLPKKSAVIPTPKVNAQTTLSFSPSSLILDSKVSTQSALDVVIDSGENKITAVQIELVYDPKLLTNVNIQQGSFFPSAVELIKQIDTTKGRVTYALGLQPTQNAKAGTGVVARLIFAPKLPNGEQTVVQFLPKSVVTAEGVVQTVLKSTANATVIKPNTSSNSATKSGSF